MRTAALALFALLAAAPVSALPIGVESTHCGCSLVEVRPETHLTVDETGGWDAFVGSAEEKAAAQLADLLHEPEPEPARWVEVCVTKPRTPETPDCVACGGGGSGGGGGGDRTALPEPASLTLYGLAVLVGAGRRRR